MEVKIKNRGGLRVSNALMWVLAVLSGTLLGIIGSFAVSVSAMSDYREMYNQWIGTDTEITAKEAQEIRITAPPPLAVMRSIDLKNHAVSLSADRVVPQVFCFYCTEFFILHTMAET